MFAQVTHSKTGFSALNIFRESVHSTYIKPTLKFDDAKKQNRKTTIRKEATEGSLKNA